MKLEQVVVYAHTTALPPHAIACGSDTPQDFKFVRAPRAAAGAGRQGRGQPAARGDDQDAGNQTISIDCNNGERAGFGLELQLYRRAR